MAENKWIKKEKMEYSKYDDNNEKETDKSSLPDGDGKNKSVNLFLVGGFMHNKKTRKILENIAWEIGVSAFLRNAIVDFASNKGFIKLENGAEKPSFVTQKMWGEIITHQKKDSRIDLTYAVAFCFLWSLPEFRDYSRSRILRRIIIAQEP